MSYSPLAQTLIFQKFGLTKTFLAPYKNPYTIIRNAYKILFPYKKVKNQVIN